MKIKNKQGAYIYYYIIVPASINTMESRRSLSVMVHVETDGSQSQVTLTLLTAHAHTQIFFPLCCHFHPTQK